MSGWRKERQKSKSDSESDLKMRFAQCGQFALTCSNLYSSTLSRPAAEWCQCPGSGYEGADYHLNMNRQNRILTAIRILDKCPHQVQISLPSTHWSFQQQEKSSTKKISVYFWSKYDQRNNPHDYREHIRSFFPPQVWQINSFILKEGSYLL